MAVNADGTVVACCADWTRKTLVGNVNTQRLQDIWNGESLHKLRFLHSIGNRAGNDACRNCAILDSLPEEDILDSLSEDSFNRLYS
jgi:radical SAM protein with 4Fe4S-binding SPASM domain